MALLKEVVELTGTDGEIFNLDEIGESKGQLERWLLIPGIEFSRIRSLILALGNMVDVDKADARYLPDLAKIVGVDLNRDLPILRQREEIKRAVEVYKRKGTTFAMRRQVEVVTGLIAEVDEMADNLLISNKEDRRSVPALPDALLTPNLPGDQASYSLDGRDERTHSPEVVLVFINGDINVGISRSAVLKLARIMPQFSPIDTLVEVFYLDNFVEDAFDRNRLSDLAEDQFDADFHLEESLSQLFTMISNTTAHESNSFYSLAMFQGGRGEIWSDEIQTL